MASTNKTTNYQLSQYIGSDKPTYLGDYNSDMNKIDTQMKTNADDIATAISGVESATSTANSAVSTATQASTTAQNANTIAGQANTTATNAQSTAQSALSTATSASNKVGDLANLDTTDKSSIVNAINEIHSSEVYSTNEVETKKIWIDGKPIYRKYFEVNVANTGTTKYTHNLNIDSLVSIDAFCTVSGQTIAEHGYRTMPQVLESTGAEFEISDIQSNEMNFYANVWSNNKAFITLEYTKKSDD